MVRGVKKLSTCGPVDLVFILTMLFKRATIKCTKVFLEGIETNILWIDSVKIHCDSREAWKSHCYP